MKLSNIFPLAFLFATPTICASDYENSIACAKKSPAINTAIEQFCNKRSANGAFVNDILVPSPRSTKGVSVNGFKVRITGTCKPKQWVPLQYCAPQFHAMCAKGQFSAKYGRNGCQIWQIQEVKGSKAGGIAAGAAADAAGKKGASNIVGALRGGG